MVGQQMIGCDAVSYQVAFRTSADVVVVARAWTTELADGTIVETSLPLKRRMKGESLWLRYRHRTEAGEELGEYPTSEITAHSEEASPELEREIAFADGFQELDDVKTIL